MYPSFRRWSTELVPSTAGTIGSATPWPQKIGAPLFCSTSFSYAEPGSSHVLKAMQPPSRSGDDMNALFLSVLGPSWRGGRMYSP